MRQPPKQRVHPMGMVGPLNKAQQFAVGPSSLVAGGGFFEREPANDQQSDGKA